MLNCVVITCVAKTGIPLSVSLINTLVKDVPPVILKRGVPKSLFAIITDGLTGIVTVAGSQWVGKFLSHI